MSVEVAKEASQLCQDLIAEVYYGFNLACILAEATPEERAAIRQVVDRAKTHRSRLARDGRG